MSDLELAIAAYERGVLAAGGDTTSVSALAGRAELVRAIAAASPGAERQPMGVLLPMTPEPFAVEPLQPGESFIRLDTKENPHALPRR